MLTARNSVHKSAAFGRNRFSHHTSRKGDSGPIVLVASGQDPARLSKDNTKSTVELIPVDNGEQSFVPDSVSAGTPSVDEKRLAKKRRQKEKRVKENSKADELGLESASHPATSNCPLNLNITDGLVGLQKSNTISSAFGDRNKIESLGLAFVKNELSLSNSDISECSESMSVDLDGFDGENAKPDRFETGPSDTLSDALDPRCSITDSSGVETSSDPDVERHTFSTNSSASSVKDHDSIVDDAYAGCDRPDNDLSSLRWDHADAQFIVVSKSKKAKSKSNKELDNVFVQPLDSSNKNCLEKTEDGHSSKSSICLRTAEPKSVLSRHSFDASESDATQFPIQNQSFGFTKDSDDQVSVAANTCSVDDTESTCTDDASSDMGLSRFDSDDYMSYLTNNDDDWTVVKTVRRTKSASQANSSKALSENRNDVTVETAKCSGDVTKSDCTFHNLVRKSGVKAGYGDGCQNSRYVNNQENANFKNFHRLNEQNLTPVGISVVGKRCMTAPNGVISGTGGNSKVILSRSSSVNGNYKSSGFKEHSGIPLALTRTEKFERFSVGNSNNSSELKRAAVKSTRVSTETSSICFTSGGTSVTTRCNNTVAGKSISTGIFDIVVAAKYVEEEYQKVMMKHRKYSELVVFYDPNKDV